MRRPLRPKRWPRPQPARKPPLQQANQPRPRPARNPRPRPAKPSHTQPVNQLRPKPARRRRERDPAAAVRQGNGTPSDTVPGEAPRATTYDHAPEASRPDRQRPSIKTKEAAQSGKPHGGEAKQPSRPTIKTKDVYLQNQQPQGEAGARSHTGRPTRKGDTGRGRRQPDTKPERGPDVPANGQNPPTRAQEMGQVQGNQTARPGGSASTQTGTKPGVTDRPPARGGARAPGQASATRPVGGARPRDGPSGRRGGKEKRQNRGAQRKDHREGRAQGRQNGGTRRRSRRQNRQPDNHDGPAKRSGRAEVGAGGTSGRASCKGQ